MADDSSPDAWLDTSPAIHVLRPTEDRSSFELDPEALAKLAAIKGPVTVMSLVGTQRGGKSTLMNLLHSRTTKGFSVGHYMDPQTTGIWIRKKQHPRNKDVTVLLVDTEGLDAPHVRQDYNWILSAFVLLVSNMFVYQTKGSIDANAVDRLGVILQVAEQIRGSTSGGAKISKSTLPHFRWLLRDHHLGMAQGTPKDEMLDKLDPTSIKALQRCFQTWDCFPLPRPADDKDLPRLDQMEFRQLAESFKEEYAIFERSMMLAIKEPTKLAGTSQTMTGTSLANLFVKYTDALNSKVGIIEELSQLPTQQQMVIQLAGERAVKTAEQAYKTAMQATHEKLPLAEHALHAAHVDAQAQALRKFAEEVLDVVPAQQDQAAMAEPSKAGWSPGGPTPSEAEQASGMADYHGLLCRKIARFDWVPRTNSPKPRVRARGASMADMFAEGSNGASAGGKAGALVRPCVAAKELTGGLYLQVWERNYTLSQASCSTALNELLEPVLARVAAVESSGDEDKEAQAFCSVEELDTALADLKSAYRARAVGPAATPVLEAWLQGEAARQHRETVRARAVHTQLLSHVSEQVSSIADRLTTQLREQSEAQEKAVATLKEEHAAKLAELAQQLEQAQEQHSKAMEEARTLADQRNGELSERISANKEQGAELGRRADAAVERMEATDARVSAQNEASENGRKELREALATATGKLDDKLDTRVREVESTLRSEASASATQLEQRVETARAAQEKAVEAVRASQREGLEKVGTQLGELTVASARHKELAEASARESAAARAEIESRLTAKHEALGQRHSELSSQHGTLQSSHEELRERVAAQGNKGEEQLTRLAELAAQHGALSSQHSALDARVQANKDSMAETASAVAAASATAKEARVADQQAGGAARAELEARLSAQLTERVQEQRTGMAEQLEALRSQAKELRQKTDEVALQHEQSAAQGGDTAERLVALEEKSSTRAKETGAALAAHKQELALLQQQHSAHVDKVAEQQQAARQQHGELADKHAELGNAHAQLKGSHEQLSSNHAELTKTDLPSTIQELKQNLEAQQGQQEEQEQALQALQTKQEEAAKRLAAGLDSLGQASKDAAGQAQKEAQEALEQLRQELVKDVEEAKEQAGQVQAAIAQKMDPLAQKVQELSKGVEKVDAAIAQKLDPVAQQLQGLSKDVDFAKEQMAKFDSLVTLKMEPMAQQLKNLDDKCARLAKDQEADAATFAKIQDGFASQGHQVKHVEQSCQASWEMLGDLSAKMADLQKLHTQMAAATPSKKGRRG